MMIGIRTTANVEMFGRTRESFLLYGIDRQATGGGPIEAVAPSEIVNSENTSFGMTGDGGAYEGLKPKLIGVSLREDGSKHVSVYA